MKVSLPSKEEMTQQEGLGGGAFLSCDQICALVWTAQPLLLKMYQRAAAADLHWAITQQRACLPCARSPKFFAEVTFFTPQPAL